MKTQEFQNAETLCPNEQNKNMIYIKNTVKASNIHIGEFTYYDCQGQFDADFERDNVLYNRPGHGDLYIGKFTSIAYGLEIIMGAANHSMRSFSTYPFSLISDNWRSNLGMTKEDMPEKGDTIIGNDVWIGRKAQIMPGVKIGDGAIIGSYSVVTKDVLPYAIAAGNPAKIVKMRFDDETIDFLEEIKWWDFEPEYLEQAIPYITSVDIEKSKEELRKIAALNSLKNESIQCSGNSEKIKFRLY